MYCFEAKKCDNLDCPVRRQKLPHCWECSDKNNKGELCETCNYKLGWEIGLVSDDLFKDRQDSIFIDELIPDKKDTIDAESNLVNIQKSNKYKNDLIVQIYMAELSKKPLSRDEEIELAKKIAGDKRASEILLLANLKLVSKIANTFSSKLSFMDLIQEGNIGLIKAISKFDYSLGYKFSTYAAYWIRYYMQKAVARQATSISIPCHLIAVANKIKNHIQSFENQFSRQPTLEELSEIVGISEEKIINILNITKTPISINSKVSENEEEGESIEYYLEDKKTLTPEEAFFEKQKTEAINEAIDSLSDNYKYVVKNYYGIGCDELTLAEIGRRKNYSRERARQILHASLLKLSQHSSLLLLR